MRSAKIMCHMSNGDALQDAVGTITKPVRLRSLNMERCLYSQEMLVEMPTMLSRILCLNIFL